MKGTRPKVGKHMPFPLAVRNSMSGLLTAIIPNDERMLGLARQKIGRQALSFIAKAQAHYNRGFAHAYNLNAPLVASPVFVTIDSIFARALPTVLAVAASKVASTFFRSTP